MIFSYILVLNILGSIKTYAGDFTRLSPKLVLALFGNLKKARLNLVNPSYQATCYFGTIG